jgi:Uma2 family endonuclease
MYNRTVLPVEYKRVPLLPIQERGPYRVADYFALPDEPRCELWRGHLVLTAAPRMDHQIVSGLLAELLSRYARTIGGRAVASPIDVELGDDTIVQPDILLLKPESLGRAAKWILGPPDLVVEIVSPSEARRDRVAKLTFYLEAGVPEYWIVDAAERTIQFLVRRDGRFVVEPVHDAIYRSPTLPGLELDLARLWNAIDDPRAEP